MTSLDFRYSLIVIVKRGSKVGKTLQPCCCRAILRGNKMEKVSKTSQRPVFGWLIAPLAVLIAVLANYVDGLMSIDVELNSDTMTPFIVTGVAGLLAVTPRILNQLGSLPESISQTQISPRYVYPRSCRFGLRRSSNRWFCCFHVLHHPLWGLSSRYTGEIRMDDNAGFHNSWYSCQF